MDKISTDVNNFELAELYRLTRALLSLRDMFDGAYERAVIAMLPEATKTRLEFAAKLAKDAGVSLARPILDDSYDALDAILDEYKHDVAESLLTAALADTVASLPEKLGALEQTLPIVPN
ncbi:MAG: hypothetical protein C3F11_16140 [Methylocystaceae bacterium]|nr:MAG: hypothetical protein C3F11_16140 [Methylocystaceae bacterium]